jgi:hypothetical protein
MEPTIDRQSDNRDHAKPGILARATVRNADKHDVPPRARRRDRCFLDPRVTRDPGGDSDDDAWSWLAHMILPGDLKYQS